MTSVLPRGCHVRYVWLHALRHQPQRVLQLSLLCPHQRTHRFSSLSSLPPVRLPSVPPPTSSPSPASSSTSSSASPASVSPSLDLHSLRSTSRPSTFQPSHNTVRDGWLQLRLILSNFVAGSKQLYHNAKRSSAIKRRLRADPSLSLQRADHRHLKRTRVDLMGGAVIVAAFWIPFIGNVVPLLAHFFPRQLPSVFVTPERKFELIEKDVQLGLPILLELQRRIDALQPQTPLNAEETAEKAAAHVSTPPVVLASPPSTHFTFTDIRHPSALVKHVALFDNLSLPSFTSSHLYHLLQHHSNLLVLHAILPSTILVRHLHHWASSIHLDDDMLRSEDRGRSLTVPELSEALHERGMYRALMSDAYRAYIEGRIRRKRGEMEGVKPAELEAETSAEEAAAKALLLADLEDWLQMTESKAAGQALPDSLLCHAGPITFSDHHLTGIFAPRPAVST